MTTLNANWDLVERLTRDMRSASTTLGREEVRWMVDYYYDIQGFRIRAANQVRAAQDAPEPHRVVAWVSQSMRNLENDIKRALDAWTKEYKVGRWLQSICGIGPVISAGLMAHIDITKAPVVSAIWRFAGMDPTMIWEKGKKRPWNASLKCLCCFKCGESFVKVQNRDSDVYGKLFAERKQGELQRNLNGQYRDNADYILTGKCPRHARLIGLGQPTGASPGTNWPCPVCQDRPEVTPKKFSRDTEAYKHLSSGSLPPAQIHARARRWAVKLFLSHLHHVMYHDWFGVDPPKPYIFEHQPPGSNHRHMVEVPNFPFTGGGKSLKDLPVRVLPAGRLPVVPDAEVDE